MQVQDAWKPNHVVVLGAGAMGCVFGDLLREVLHQISGKGGTGANPSSLCRDILNQRPPEIDYRNGVVVKPGRQHGIPTPVNRTLVATVKGLESRYVAIGTKK